MQENLFLKISIVAAIVAAIVGLIYFKGDAEPAPPSTSGQFDLHVDADFQKDAVISQGLPTLLDVGGAECIPCKEMAPVLEKVNADLKGQAIIKFVDYWKYPALAEQFDFSVIPTQFFYDEHGQLYTTHEGGITEAEILATFAEMGYVFN